MQKPTRAQGGCRVAGGQCNIEHKGGMGCAGYVLNGGYANAVVSRPQRSRRSGYETADGLGSRFADGFTLQNGRQSLAQVALVRLDAALAQVNVDVVDPPA